MCKNHRPKEMLADGKAQPAVGNEAFMEMKYCYECCQWQPLVLWGLKTVPIEVKDE